MSINDLPVLSILRTKMQWHQERQRVLSENVSNSNTPNFRPRDLVEPKFDEKGAKVDKGDVQVDPNDGALLRVSLNPLPPGTYKVVWHVVSVDTHPTEGDFTFQVAP